MRYTPQKKHTRKIIIPAIGVLLISSIALIYVYAFKGNILGWKASYTTTNSNNVDYEPATIEQKQAGSQVKTGSNSDTPSAPTVIQGSNKKSVQMTITAVNQNGSTLQIRSLISAVENTGVCTLTLTSADKPTVTKTANSQALASTSTCQGFDISTSELSAGTWHAVIEYSSASLTGSTAQDIVIK